MYRIIKGTVKHMRYNKVDFTEQSRAKIEYNYNQTVPFFNLETSKESIEKFGNIDMSDIKTLYAKEGPSHPIPLGPIEDEAYLTQESYHEALDKVGCVHRFTGAVYGIETKSGTFIDMRDTPLPLVVITPYETLTQQEVENEEEIIAEMDADMVSKSLTDLATDELQP